uniref:Sugar phosphate transporter domain-containing protein n=1 Tax=Mantoniella antarctica TaxID=81844 RepID=A0A7S0S9T5_9CHLO|mmetsp:Transcript_12048/g.29218  ORF Transcript_12048/g.29218 Transcript_12048/m.29218 type:complete len:359 (+) Transcript_12048:40-1116(+)
MSNRLGAGKHIPSADTWGVSEHLALRSDNSKSNKRKYGGKGDMTDIGTVGALGLSVVSSVSIVIVNKYLISTLGYRYVTFLTALHQIVTAGALRVASKVGLLEPKAIDRGALLRFSVLNGVSIGFLNLSLGFNSVGFYQMTKLAIIPCTVFIQTSFYGKVFSTRVKACLGVLLGGVAIATITDLQLNALGATLSFCAVVTTCVSQIWTNTMQKQYGITSTQLLFAASPFMAATLSIIAVPLDNALVGGTPIDFEYTTAVTCVAILSCLIAVAVNFSTFLVIGKCDAVTYQVLGHLKTMLVLAFGFFMLNNPASMRNIGGILCALLGMMAYGYCENLDKKQAEASKIVLPSNDYGKSQQ